MKRSVFLILLLLISNIAFAGVDKSGVKPSVLSLPSGPGSIEGLGESFEPQLNSGTAPYRIPLKTPPGRAGFAPELSLTYNSGNGNGIFGLGWKSDIPYIQRQTDKGLPYYTDFPDKDGTDNDKDGETDEADEFDTFVFSDGEELVPLADGSFRCENEGSFVKFARSAGGWTGTRKDGTVLRFGMTAGARIQDDSGRIFLWLLEDMSDTNGNTIQFFYEKKDAGFQLYCAKIQYNGTMTIAFDYEPRPDILTDYRPGYELRTAYRCKAIYMKAGNEAIRSYHLTYETTDDFQPLSLLASVTQVGRDGISSLPPARFAYTRFQGASAVPADMPSAPKLSLNDGNIDLIDLNADGLPDILDTNDVIHDYYLNMGPDSAGTVRWSEKAGMTSSSKLIYLSADSTQLADMDSDGRTDLLDLFGTDMQFYRIKNTDMEFKWESGGLIANAGFNFQDKNVRPVDLNNDKRTDVMQTGLSGSMVWLNLKSGRWSNAFTPALPNANLQFDRSYVRLADMNGDRIQDLLWIQNDLCSYYPGKGFGEFGTAVSMSNPPFGVSDESRLLIADVNGDGMSDALYVGTGQVFVWINLGLHPESPAVGRFAEPFKVSAPYTDSFTVFRQADMNGNGSTDILWNTHPGGGDQTFAYLDFAPGEQPYQLKTITNGIGKTTTISYRSSVEDMIRDRDAGKPWSKSVPFPVPVVAKVENDDGLNTYTTEFYYHDGYYDGNEKEFRGFAQAEKKETGDVSAPDLFMAYQFDTGDVQKSLKGKPLALEARASAGEVFYRENYLYGTRILGSGAGGDIRKVTFPYQKAKTRDILEKGSGTPVQLKWEFAYDNYGNMTKETEYGRMDAGWDDERITQTTYTAAYPSGNALWILDKAVESKTTDENGAVFAKTRHYYDGNSSLGAVSKGNLTRSEDWISGDHYALSGRNDYDEYGNIIATYDPLYPAQPGHWRELLYDDTFHTFPVRETIHTGNSELVMSASYDCGFGVMTASTDFNGHTSSYAYDTFGRLTSITKPPDTGHTLEYDYVLAHELGGGKLINWVETRQRDQSSDGFLSSRTFYDGLSRKIMTRSEGENPGQIVVSDTVQFNARQQPRKKYLPYFETGTLDFTTPLTEGVGFTEHFYDALAREIKAVQPDKSYSLTAYKPLSKTVQDEEQTRSDSLHVGCGMRYVEDGLQDKDGKGRLRQVFEIVKLSDSGEALSSPTEWKTTYSYDILDNLTAYTDSQGNQKIIQYDGLKRKTFMNDPDRGKMYYIYDDAGNLVKTTDAKGQVIEYTYDGVNRLTAEYYGQGKSEADVTYHYDEPFGPLAVENIQSDPAAAVSDSVLSEVFYSAYDLNKDGKTDVADVIRRLRIPDRQGQALQLGTPKVFCLMSKTSPAKSIILMTSGDGLNG